MEQGAMNTREKIYLKAIELYGIKAQEEVAIEEMSELTKEIVKSWRGKENEVELAEEIADVEIMLEQLKIIHNCGELVDRWKNEKVYRLQERIIKGGN